MSHLPLPGSTRGVPFGAYRFDDADASALVEATLVLRRPDGEIDADPADVAAVEAFAAAHGLSVIAHSPAARAVGVAGTVEQMNAAFLVDLGLYRHENRAYRGHEGDIHVPETLIETVAAVLGLDERTQARSPAQMSPRAVSGFTPQQVAAHYKFPANADGSGQTIAVIELGGGYRQSDLTQYFSSMGLKTPQVTAVSVGGVTNAPGGSSADVEVALDVEVIGAVAQGAAQAVYFGPNTDQGFYNTIASAVHDSVRKPSVISISWGSPESNWTPAVMDVFDALFADAGALGITVCVAAGDNGSTDGTSSSQVDFPASSPHVVACGGTTLTTQGEWVWNETARGSGATGGGVSQHFGLPAYQANSKVPANPAGQPGRGVPDVAGCADPLTGYSIYVGGQSGYVGGTSAVAPLWAALIAIANQVNNTRAGDVHSVLYSNPTAFFDVVQGNNGAYQAVPGWDACTGLGTPLGARVVKALAPAPVSAPPPAPTPTPAPVQLPADVTALLAALQSDLSAQLQKVTGVIAEYPAK